MFRARASTRRFSSRNSQWLVGVLELFLFRVNHNSWFSGDDWQPDSRRSNIHAKMISASQILGLMHFHIVSSSRFVENQISAGEAICPSIGSRWVAVSSGRPNSLYINCWHCEASSWLKSFRQSTSLREVMFTPISHVGLHKVLKFFVHDVFILWIRFIHSLWIKFRIETNWIPWIFLFLTMFPPRQGPAREWMHARRFLGHRARAWLHRIVSFGRGSEIDECACRTTEEAGSGCPLQRVSEAQRARNEKTPNECTADQWRE
jgi:hypothetical protein